MGNKFNSNETEFGLNRLAKGLEDFSFLQAYYSSLKLQRCCYLFSCFIAYVVCKKQPVFGGFVHPLDSPHDKQNEFPQPFSNHSHHFTLEPHRSYSTVRHVDNI